MDNGGGPVFVVVVGMGYLIVEAMLSLFVAATLGLIFGVFIVAGFLLAGVKFIWDNPLRSAQAWCLFAIGGSTAVVAPFLIMYGIVLGGHTERKSSELGAGGNLLSFLCGIALIASPFVIAKIYRHCQQMEG